MSLTEQLTSPIEEIFHFVRPKFRSIDDDVLRDMIVSHWFYGTIDAVYKEEKIVACVRWNVSHDGKTFDVLDLVVAPGEHGFILMKHLIARNWHRFPTVDYIKFERQDKYPNRGWRLYAIRDLLKVRMK